jgi:hypothetical protein
VIEPTKYDITIHQGATFELPVHYKDSNGNSVDMNGYTVAGMVYNRLGNIKLSQCCAFWHNKPGSD